MKVTFNTQVLPVGPTGITAPTVQVVPEAIAKSAVLLPDSDADVMVSGALPVLVSVIDCGLLVVLATWVNERLLVLSETLPCGAPVP